MSELADSTVGLIPVAYRPEAAAKAVGLSRAAIYEEIAAGRIEVRKRGTATLILADELRRWAAALPIREAR